MKSFLHCTKANKPLQGNNMIVKHGKKTTTSCSKFHPLVRFSAAREKTKSHIIFFLAKQLDKHNAFASCYFQ